MTKCPNCGSVIKEGTPFCAQCGVKQAAAASEVAVASNGTAPHDFRKYFFVPAAISALGEPGTFRRLLSRCLLIFGVLWALVGLFLSIYGVIQDWAPGVGNLPAYIILLPIMLVALYMTSHAIVQRAKDLAILPADANMATRIFALLFRLLGEVGTVIILQRGLVAGIAAWAGALKPASAMLSNLQQIGIGIAYTPENAFVIGLMAIAYGILTALLWLVASYFASEWVSQRVSVTTDVRSIAGHR